MEFLKQYEKDCMRRAMLKHEETFREQVMELHRIYRVQKLMMRDMRNAKLTSLVNSAYFQTENQTCSDQRRCSNNEENRARRSLDLELPAEDSTDGNEADVDLTLTIGPSKSKEDTSFNSDSATSFSSSSTTDSGTENLKVHNWGLTMTPMSYPGQENVFGMEGKMRQKRLEQPAWHIQCLSLNMRIQ